MHVGRLPGGPERHVLVIFVEGVRDKVKIVFCLAVGHEGHYKLVRLVTRDSLFIAHQMLPFFF